MKVIVDTSVWSLFLRQRNRPEPEVAALKKLIRAQHVQMLGVVKQELLSGLKESRRFDQFLSGLRGFPDLLASSQLTTSQRHNTTTYVEPKGFRAPQPTFSSALKPSITICPCSLRIGTSPISLSIYLSTSIQKGSTDA